jgi:hypothetical protein
MVFVWKLLLWLLRIAMNFITPYFFILLLATYGPTKIAVPANQKPVVVVELFTSQGCSSCPAADALLNETVRRSDDSPAVLGLSFHVTYWNDLGWKDPYSSEAFTERQKKYADVMKLESIYTPEMIVNGVSEFVGSDRKSLSAAIERGAHEVPAFGVVATAVFSAEKVTVGYQVDRKPANTQLNIALVAPRVENEVLRGENKGKKLTHANVVVMLKTIDLAPSGEVVLAREPGLLRDPGLFVVLFVQDSQTLKILSATRASHR